MMTRYNLKQYSQILRKNSTKEERHLWYDFLKNYPVQLNRQKVIGNYIVDFYCDRAKLVIELDGSQHYSDDSKLYDLLRTEYLDSLGITVIRFTNLDINQNFYNVCTTIKNVIRQRLPLGEAVT